MDAPTLRETLPAKPVLFWLPTMKYELLPLLAEDIQPTGQILEHYANTRIDFVDASLATIAERLRITRILTLDQRDFSLIHPEHTDHFELLPQ